MASGNRATTNTNHTGHGPSEAPRGRGRPWERNPRRGQPCARGERKDAGRSTAFQLASGGRANGRGQVRRRAWTQARPSALLLRAVSRLRRLGRPAAGGILAAGARSRDPGRRSGRPLRGLWTRRRHGREGGRGSSRRGRVTWPGLVLPLLPWKALPVGEGEDGTTLRPPPPGPAPTARRRSTPGARRRPWRSFPVVSGPWRAPTGVGSAREGGSCPPRALSQVEHPRRQTAIETLPQVL